MWRENTIELAQTNAIPIASRSPLTVRRVMSLSDISWSNFGPYSHPSHGDPLSPHSVPQSYYSDAAPLALQLSQFTTLLSRGNLNPAIMELSPEEMERFQKLSNEYEPDIQGPLVSQKQQSQNITLEYANADPTLATKTRALAITHPYSRTMKGDGNCGWRAVAFGYFENLFALRDTVRVEQELLRIKSLSRLLDQVGQSEHLYEIFVDATESLLTNLISEIHKGIQSNSFDESFLLEAFNNEYESSAIITHFRLLTSAWMKLNPHRYQAFLSMPLDSYCATRVETVKTEIDEVGLQALVDGVIEGSGFAVEILYLDRSEGDAVTPHVLTPNRPSPATIRLLYRPGHYDLIYRAEPTVNMAPIVNFQYGMTTNYSPWDQGALSFDVNPHLMAVPNLMMDPSFAFGANTMPPAPPSPYVVSPPSNFYPPPVSAQPPPPPLPPPVMPSSPPPGLPVVSRSSDGPQIRLNPLVMKPNLSHSLPVTTPFKNSPYNQAHFQNSDFEPIHWEPSEHRK
ncbi:hypothetical protein DTO212C5_149 [Paecilomyces variotii]|nr:hypothetical protein DTO195F2_8883 [Paecilomyces variotii]KAJ9273870.1 hypothetical protein DTO212C5_149 [Paecilomyces variotii]KAJ9286221.1 hypothetical protein DTO021C3_6114 [Paecilomyces variotii]KAJ9372434.1 hypothetical protein DTO282E5_2761 [Paecilomyces variotii]